MSKRIKSKIVVAAIFGVGLAALCETAVMAKDDKVVTVTEKDTGTTIKLDKGDTLVVKLDANAGTLFRWKLVKNDKGILPLQSEATETKEKPVPGGKLTRVWRFKGETAGNSEVEMHFGSPLEKEKTPARTFKLNVKVE